MTERTMAGRLYLHFEQGYEGSPWAFQDEKFIFKDNSMPNGERWSYDGLHILKLGDHLKVSDKGGNIVFEGRLEPGDIKASVVSFPVWYPAGLLKEEWMKLFDESKGYRAELTPSAPQEVQVAVGRLMPGNTLTEIIFYSIADLKYLIHIKCHFPGRRGPSKLAVVIIPEALTSKKRKEFISEIYPVGSIRDRSLISCPRDTPERLKYAISRHVKGEFSIVSYEKDALNGLFSWEAIVVMVTDGGPVMIRLHYQSREVYCACIYKKDKLGRWKAKVPKKDRICTCEDLPKDVLISVWPL